MFLLEIILNIFLSFFLSPFDFAQDKLQKKQKSAAEDKAIWFPAQVTAPNTKRHARARVFEKKVSMYIKKVFQKERKMK